MATQSEKVAKLKELVTQYELAQGEAKERLLGQIIGFIAAM
jgi:hypothetical protein